MRLRGVVGVAGVAALMTAACGGGSSDPGSGGDSGDDSGDGSAAAGCDPDVLDEALADDGPIELTLWHGYSDVTDETIDELVDGFNETQDDIQVSVVAQGDEVMSKLTAGRTTGDLPDVFFVNEISTQRVVDTELTLPMDTCVDAHSYDMSDMLPQAVSYYTVDDTLQAMPYNIASPVVVVNDEVVAGAGREPGDVPTDWDEFMDSAQMIADSDQPGVTAGLGLERYGWLFEQAVALHGGSFVDNGNGRDARATAVAFDGEAGQEVFTSLGEGMEGGAVSTTEQGEIDHLLGLGQGEWAYSFATSSALGPIFELLTSGQYAETDYSVAPMPLGSPDGGTIIGGGALHIVSPSEDPDPVRAAAAWRFVEYVLEVENVAHFSARTGYVPVRVSAGEEQELLDRWDEAPYFRVPYDQLVDGADNEATAGAVLGEMENIRSVVEDAWREMANEGLDPEAALESVVDESNDLIEDYNSRID